MTQSCFFLEKYTYEGIVINQDIAPITVPMHFSIYRQSDDTLINTVIDSAKYFHTVCKYDKNNFNAGIVALGSSLDFFNNDYVYIKHESTLSLKFGNEEHNMKLPADTSYMYDSNDSFNDSTQIISIGLFEFAFKVINCTNEIVLTNDKEWSEISEISLIATVRKSEPSQDIYYTNY